MSVTALSRCGGLQGGLTQNMNFSPSEPLYWNYFIVSETDANGNATVIDFYNDDVLQFVYQYTYDANDNVSSLRII